MTRRALIVLAASSILLLGAAPADPPESPVSFITTDELKALLDRGVETDIIDVRQGPQYVETHIRGARSMPLGSVPERAREISKTGLVVFY